MSYNTFYGPDISEYQTITNWAALNNGAAFIMIKSGGADITEGNFYLDAKYQENINNARSFGNALPRLVYFIAGGYNVGSDPINEANQWVDNVGVNLEVGEAYVCDAERGVATEPAYALEWLNQAKTRLGWGGGLYISQNRLVTEDFSAVAAGNYFVFPADWGVPPSGNFSVGAFGSYSFQQYTDHATWPGITAPCDGDCFFGNAAIDILKFGKPAPAAPPPTPALPPSPSAQPAPIPAASPPEPIPEPAASSAPAPEPTTPGVVITPVPSTPPIVPQDPSKEVTVSPSLPKSHWYDFIIKIIRWFIS